MFSTKQLSEEQIATIKSWAEAGAKLPDIQLKMREEMDIPVTYMDTRIVILDLGIELVKDASEEEPVVEEVIASEMDAPHTGGVHVTMDSLPIPGMIVSGKAVFSDGEHATWTIDQNGQPGLDPETTDYNPTDDDIVEFQKQLRALIQSLKE